MMDIIYHGEDYMLQYIFQHQAEIIFFPTVGHPSQYLLSHGKKSSSVILSKLVLSSGLSINVEGSEESSRA